MSDKNDQRPWNKKFEEATDKNGELSRIKLRKQNHSNGLIAVISFGAVLLIAIVALIMGLSKNNNDGKSSASSQKISSTKVENHESKATKHHDKDDSKVSKHNDNKANSKTMKSSNKLESSSEDKSKMTASTKNDEKSSSSTVSSESNNKSDYVTVQAGQGVYRVAKNAGISEQQLLQLNGLTTSSQLRTGQKLRIK